MCCTSRFSVGYTRASLLNPSVACVDGTRATDTRDSRACGLPGVDRSRWVRVGAAYPLPFVTTLVLNVSMPALLFHTLATAVVDIYSLGRMALATLLVHLLFMPLAVIALRLGRRDWRLAVAHVVGNTGNLGLPVCLFAFGEEGLAYAITFFSVQCVLLFSLGDAVYAGRVSIARAVRSPILISVLIAVLVRALSVPMPDVLMSTLELLGQIVIPLMLITLGVSLAGMRARDLPVTLLWSAIRTLMALAVGLIVVWLLDLEGVARGVLLIETLVPVAVFNFLLAEKHGRDSAEVSGLILVTHLAAIAYLPLLLGFLLG